MRAPPGPPVPLRLRDESEGGTLTAANLPSDA